jgi:hypothetical protein
MPESNRPQYELLPLQKNRVFEMLQEHGLDVLEFKWDFVKGPSTHNTVSLVSHKRLNVHFTFDVASDGLYWLSSYPATTASSASGKDLGAEGMMQHCRTWIEAIAPQVKAPDLWAFATQQEGIPSPTRNTPFTPDERHRLAEGLRQIEEFVYNAEPSLEPPQRAAIAARFKFLEQATQRLGRLDWTTIVVGNFFQMASEKLITVQTFTSLYHMAGQMMSSILRLGTSVADVATKLIGA